MANESFAHIETLKRRDAVPTAAKLPDRGGTDSETGQDQTCGVHVGVMVPKVKVHRQLFAQVLQQGRHFFCARTKEKASIRHSDLRRLCGFVVLTFFIARPTSRAETVWSLLPVKKLNTKLVEGKELGLSFPQHKTQSTYGCLIAKYSDVLSSILLTYLKRIRPVLLKLPEIWGEVF